MSLGLLVASAGAVHKPEEERDKGGAEEPAPAPSPHEGVEVSARRMAQQHLQAVELVGQIGGQTGVVTVQGSRVYLGVGPRLVTLDVSNPAQPAVVGQTALLPDIIEDVAIAGDPSTGSGGTYAYVAVRQSGLHIMDVSDPTTPVVVGSYDTPGRALRIVVAGQHAYIADYDRGLRIIDVTDPTAPTEVSCYLTPWPVSDVAVSGRYVYVVGEGGLIVLRFAPSTSASVTPAGGSLTSPLDGTACVFPAGTFTDTVRVEHSGQESPPACWILEPTRSPPRRTTSGCGRCWGKHDGCSYRSS